VGFVDLHLHSTASDGVLPPTEVVRRIADIGLEGLSLTDHDTVDGVEEAASEARRLGLDFLVGAELSANAPGQSIHILAYGFDPTDRDLRTFFADFRSDRLRRTEDMVGRLRSLGVDLTVQDVLDESGDGVPTRAHVARALLSCGWIRYHEEAFQRYLSRGKPAFVEKQPSPPERVIELVRAAGGVTILAHPGRDFTQSAIGAWIDAGFDGVEVLHPRNDPGVRRALDSLAERRGLLRGGGSDWHGTDSGAPPGSQRVPAAWMREIEARCSGSGPGPVGEPGSVSS
jgi:predicted metal-dependent phosphoesterase TrpH